MKNKNLKDLDLSLGKVIISTLEQRTIHGGQEVRLPERPIIPESCFC